jgi:N-methylhydantoinase A
LDVAALGTVADRFHDAHRALYGYDLRGQPGQQVEWVNLRVSGIGPITRPALREQAAGDGDAARARTGHRPVCFDAGAGYVDTDIYWRDHLRPGDVIAGPAIVEEYGSTVPIHPGYRLVVDGYQNLLVTVQP